MYLPNVKFWEVNAGKRVRQRAACFSGLGRSKDSFYDASRKMPEFVLYPCPIDKSITTEALIYYINFLPVFLDTGLYTYKLGKACIQPNIIWKFKSSGMTYAKALLYLTAFRYPDEYPDIINDFYTNTHNKGMNNEQLFKEFQSIHAEYSESFPTYNNNKKRKKLSKVEWLGGHGLMAPYSYGNQTFNAISIEAFKNNLANKNIQQVIQHFNLHSS
jgi:hypothetical protein